MLCAPLLALCRERLILSSLTLLSNRQWAHTFLSIKFIYYALAFDDLQESAYSISFCVGYALIVLDRFKTPDGLGFPPVIYYMASCRLTRHGEWDIRDIDA